MKGIIEILILLAIIVLSSCSLDDKRTLTFEELEQCSSKMLNNRLFDILKDRDSLMLYFQFSQDEIEALVTTDTIFAKESNLVIKLIGQISNLKEIKVNCQTKLGLNVGDLAILSLHRLLDFPFAKATGRQWCHGPMISIERQLPEDFISFTRDGRERVIARFIEYYYQYLNSGKRKQ